MGLPLRETCAWVLATLRGKEGEFYQAHPEAYEKIVDLVQGRRSVAIAVADLLEQEFDGCEPPDMALDTACGTGLVTDAIAERFPNARVIGMDVSQPSLDYAAQTKNERIYWFNGSFEDLRDVEDDSVDVYTMLAAYRHIQDREAFFREISRVLSDRGVAVIPKLDMLWVQLFEARNLAMKEGLEVELRRFEARSLVSRVLVRRALLLRKPA